MKRSKLIAAREDAKLTQTQLAERVGTSQSTISKLEQGETSGSGEVLAAICRELSLAPWDAVEIDLSDESAAADSAARAASQSPLAPTGS